MLEFSYFGRGRADVETVQAEGYAGGLEAKLDSSDSVEAPGKLLFNPCCLGRIRRGREALG